MNIGWLMSYGKRRYNLKVKTDEQIETSLEASFFLY